MGKPTRRAWARGLLIAAATAVALTGCSGHDDPDLLSGTATPSSSAANECVTSSWQRVSSRVLQEYPVGGRLATDADARLAVGSLNKTQWALRGAPAQPRITLLAQRLGTAEVARFTAEATSGYDYSGLTDWGPTYYTSLELHTMGCWRISVEGADSEDAIVLLVGRRTS